MVHYYKLIVLQILLRLHCVQTKKLLTFLTSRIVRQNQSIKRYSCWASSFRLKIFSLEFQNGTQCVTYFRTRYNINYYFASLGMNILLLYCPVLYCSIYFKFPSGLTYSISLTIKKLSFCFNCEM